ncbi:hypothetical protein HOY82DRAFT_540669 [Tuber indicum]|nr:hypothetical protein HOY82DRAFT_540669 [Tuber indicum]
MATRRKEKVKFTASCTGAVSCGYPPATSTSKRLLFRSSPSSHRQSLRMGGGSLIEKNSYKYRTSSGHQSTHAYIRTCIGLLYPGLSLAGFAHPRKPFQQGRNNPPSASKSQISALSEFYGLIARLADEKHSLLTREDRRLVGKTPDLQKNKPLSLYE